MKKYLSPADISEMKARGYDASVIAEAEQQSEGWGKIQRLCCAIEEAFAGVTLGNGIGLQEAQGLDDYDDAATGASYRASDEKEDWHRIPTEALNHCNSSLSFFDAEGMRFHLPAYLLADLQNLYHFGMAFALTYDLSDRKERQFKLLNLPQRNAVRAFLLHILDEPDYQFDRSEILHALEEYWTAPS